MRIAELVTRFQFYGEKHVLIKHKPGAIAKAFLNVEFQDIEQATASGLSLPALFLQTPDTDKSGAYDNMGEDFQFTFMVLQKLGRLKKAELIDFCKEISDDIINLMLLDVQKGDLPSFAAGTSEGLVGPITADIYGWGVSVTITDSYNAEVDPERWLHLKTGGL